MQLPEYHRRLPPRQVSTVWQRGAGRPDAAARTGSATPLPTGDLDADFSKYANLADASIALLAVEGVNPQPVRNAPITMDFTPREKRFNDGQRIVCEVGKYQPNAWGLLDPHGIPPIPLQNRWPGRRRRRRRAGSPRRRLGTPISRSARRRLGTPISRSARLQSAPPTKRATSAFRLSYPKWQKVYNIGFRVVCPAK